MLSRALHDLDLLVGPSVGKHTPPVLLPDPVKQNEPLDCHGGQRHQEAERGQLRREGRDVSFPGLETLPW